ncbi:hypothetical protein [Stakelama marina]|uniref:Uncharacterized protein n=1 Tax=Stakelama marina TaxID=2826939 RepID=A0A8T4IBM8_9SPHN|nr:hypothetical protein [Stakelama marina]MBR0551843.1 hypothetical protein [Stakelama marina]
MLTSPPPFTVEQTTDDATSLSQDAGFDLAQEILLLLAQSWPGGRSLDPDGLHLPSGDAADRLFLVTIQTLSDHGLLMIDALLLGVHQRPFVLEASITPRGRDLLALLGANG